MTAVQSPLADVLLDLSEQTGLSVVAPPNADALVTVDFKGVNAREAFELVASQSGFSVTVQDGVAVLLPAGEVVQSVGVYRVGFGTVDEARQALQNMLGGQAKVLSVSDRIVVAGTRASNELAASVMRQYQVGPDAWLVEVRLVELSAQLRRALGLDWSAAFDGQAGVDWSTGSLTPEDVMPEVFGARATALVRVIGEAAMNSSDAELVTHATLYLLEGETSTLELGQVVPYPTRSVINEQGQLVTRDVERISTGFTLNVSGQRVPGGLRLGLDPTISEVTGFVDSIPILSQRSVSATVMLRSGEWLILSGLDQLAETLDRSHSPLPGDLRVKSRNNRSLHVLVRAVRVGSSDANAGIARFVVPEGGGS